MEKDFQRWTAKRKVELLLQLIKGEATLVDACREHDLKQSEVEGWMEAFLQAGERGLKARVNLDELVAEGDRMVGDDIAEDGIRFLQAINFKDRARAVSLAAE